MPFLRLRMPCLALVLVSLSTTAGSTEIQRSEDLRSTVLAERGSGGECIRTQGYWKNHEEEWPTTQLVLGNTIYDQAQLLSIFNLPVGGNGLVSLAHQLIAAKLNIAAGGDAEIVIQAILDADDLIGDLVVPPVGAGHLDPAVASPLVDEIDDWNNGRTGSGSCVTDLCWIPGDLVCFHIDNGRFEVIGGFVIGPDECDLYYECLGPSPVEPIGWGVMKMLYR